MTFYEEMQTMATELLTEFKQGAVSLRRVTVTPGANPWDPPTRTTADTPLSATLKRMHRRYENGILVIETGDKVTFAVPAGITPLLTDQLVINGQARAITNLTAVPPSGTPVVYKAWCAG
jgi:hypothetical protein